MDGKSEDRRHGTLSDVEDIELASVEYAVRFEQSVGSSPGEWGGEITLPESTMTIEPGRYILTLDDGTRVDIEIEPLGTGDGDARTIEFRGVGVFGRLVDEV